uniref:DDE Tnp4 domain-containing protein n=1 Tax=Mola mola TaxID=94237 RepID=A0A3Q3W0U6_MOLML
MASGSIDYTCFWITTLHISLDLQILYTLGLKRIFWRRLSLDLSKSEIIHRYTFCAVPGVVKLFDKLLTTLHVLAFESFQNTIAGISRLSQPSISRAMWDVVPALLRRVGNFIMFPQNWADIEETKQTLFNFAGFLNIVGAIDCTHVVAKFPGSMVTACYWIRFCAFLMVGNSGLQLKPWLMTLVHSPTNKGESASLICPIIVLCCIRHNLAMSSWDEEEETPIHSMMFEQKKADTTLRRKLISVFVFAISFFQSLPRACEYR